MWKRHEEQPAGLAWLNLVSAHVCQLKVNVNVQHSNYVKNIDKVVK